MKQLEAHLRPSHSRIVHYQLCFCCVNWKSKIVATAVESITLYWKMFMINQVNETVSSEPLVVSYLHEILNTNQSINQSINQLPCWYLVAIANSKK
jgi:hypothetical protein